MSFRNETLMQNSSTVNFINQLPGYYVQKNLDSSYRLMSEKSAKLFGYKSSEEMIGLTDYDLKCSAVEYADEFLFQDQMVKQHGFLKYLGYFNYSNDEWKVTICEKLLHKDFQDMATGFNCYMVDITDANIIDMARFLVKSDEKHQFEMCQKQFAYIINNNFFNHNLSQREAESLFFLLRGKSAKSIGKILHLSHKTVEGYIEQLKRKLGCTSKTDLFENALAKGYLNVLPATLLTPKLSEKLSL